jgi:uncharacterized membrane protein
MSHHDIESIENDIKSELQLERMILFSDAVFAIVITLMAIELRIPESDHKLTSEEWKHLIKHLNSVFSAYAISFFFIGMTWYRHLKMFSFLKDYDGGLVFRNMLLLFCIGLFPFAASVISTPSETPFPFITYASVITLCNMSQFALQYYIVIQRPNLRNSHPIDRQLLNLKMSGVVSIALTATFILVAVSYILLNTDDKPAAFAWFLPFVLVVRYARKKFKVKNLPPALVTA